MGLGPFPVWRITRIVQKRTVQELPAQARHPHLGRREPVPAVGIL